MQSAALESMTAEAKWQRTGQNKGGRNSILILQQIEQRGGQHGGHEHLGHPASEH